MPNTETTQLKFVERCQGCGAVFSDSLIRIPQMTEAVKKLTEYLDTTVFYRQQGADLDYLDKQFGQSIEKAISNILRPAECPDCHRQHSGGPTHEAQEAVNALIGLMAKVRICAQLLQTR
jgi:hypothetical protein